jgi:hypothetical protein
LQFEYWKRFEAIEYRLENLENISIEDERKIHFKTKIYF